MGKGSRAGVLAVTFQLPPDMLLKREATARALTAAGYPVAPATLARKACRGGGPPFAVFGRNALYRWQEALDWAEGRLRVHDGEVA